MMGCPKDYYIRALRKIASRLCDEGNVRSILKENDMHALENIVADLKEKVEDKEFYFESGVVFDSVLALMHMNNMNDELDACRDGLTDFEEFIKGL